MGQALLAKLLRMESNGGGTDKQEWVVVCVGCLRIKRGGRWTSEQAEDLRGRSSGFCDDCAKVERKRQGGR